MVRPWFALLSALQPPSRIRRENPGAGIPKKTLAEQGTPVFSSRRAVKTLDSYGLFVRGFNAKLQKIDDEPDHDLETVLTLELSVTSSLEPEWSLVSERAKAQDMTRDLRWADRLGLARPSHGGSLRPVHFDELSLGWASRKSEEPCALSDVGTRRFAAGN